MKRATIDIGSNSILLLAGEYAPNKISETLNESRITSLGKNLDLNKRFETESMENSFQALKEYAELLIRNNFDVKETIVTATEASRVATNAKEFFAKIKSELGFTITTINAKGEAHYTALGVLSTLINDKDPECVIMDIGGASTELMRIQKSPYQLLKTISMPIGSVRATDWIANNQIDTKFLEIENNFPMNEYTVDTLVCVAGSMTALGAVYLKQREFNADSLEGLCVKKIDFINFLEELEKSNPEELLREFPFLGKRVKSIRGGVFVVKSIVSRVCQKEILISTRGLRYGTFIEGKIDGNYTN